MYDESSLVIVNAKKNDVLSVLSKKRKSRWDDNPRPCIITIIIKCLCYIAVKHLSRRTRWGPEYEKSFTPLSFTYIPDNMMIDDYEILLSKYCAFIYK